MQCPVCGSTNLVYIGQKRCFERRMMSKKTNKKYKTIYAKETWETIYDVATAVIIMDVITGRYKGFVSVEMNGIDLGVMKEDINELLERLKTRGE